ncbi:MAG TPA: hypothetical protein DCS66_14005, partial [Flavobacteriaceae bacterium]|nr:hypothetical protein [Flavobacteriaceae bacterium]
MNKKQVVSKDEITAFFDPEIAAPDFEDKKLGRVATLATQILDFDKEIAVQESAVKELKEKRRQLAEDLLPAVMTEHGLTEITLSDGSKVSVRKFYSCTIPAEQTEKAFDWLREKGHEGLIKHRITVDFSREKDDQALRIKEDLENKGLYPADKEWVEPSTLRGFA